MNCSHMGDQGLIACSDSFDSVLMGKIFRKLLIILNQNERVELKNPIHSRTTLRLVLCLFAESLRTVNSCLNKN